MLPVFIPNLPDCEYQYGEKPLTADQIIQFARDYEEWLIVDLEHEFLYTGQVIGTVIKSHVNTEPVTVKFIDSTPREYPTGTWFVTLKITNQDVIQGIHNEHYTGGSATTIEREDTDKLRKILNVPITSTTKSKIKRIPISEIKNPVVITISIVHSPCVPLANFVV
ncbi:phage-related protein [Methanobrevibacter ruminantium M1]|uniref:Phage-related protein n=1 Tax=Methanobrevibacter ruminantium (strain ATCC 35063 / DSM 1093 / JCM 13430 / OCM 146 / M1) TaxID=634498 RepID=D3E4L4_METRM|nr:XkdF-like putative serine protease domain-containing protein [Methanobrevibacter ruminantium]ADC45910.1 phage-related protein [Methanobrevibacter ruminantium M1]